MQSGIDGFVNRLKQRSDSAQVWRHPYFGGQPTRQKLKIWLKQAGPFEARYPDYLTAMLDNPKIPDSCRKVIEENLQDELGNGDSKAAHFALFKEALRGAEIPPDEYEQSILHPGTARMLDQMAAVCSGEDPIGALAYICQVELFTPGEYSKITSWMKRIFPESEESWMPYFAVHVTCDEHHFVEMAQALYLLCEGSDELTNSAFSWQAKGLHLDHEFYDDLHKAATSA